MNHKKSTVSRPSIIALSLAVLVSSNICCDHNTEPIPPYLEDILESNSDAYFSLRFYEEPPEGIALAVLIHNIGIDNSCEVIGNEDTNMDFGAIRIVMNKATAGKFRVKQGNLEGPDYRVEELIASVAFIQVSNWEEERKVFAYGGDVTIESAPVSIEEWKEGKNCKLSFNVDFPFTPPNVISTIECSSGTGSGTVCQCMLSTGNIEACESGKTNYDCCLDEYGGDSISDTSKIEMSINATQCHYLCRATDVALFEIYCKELAP